jgi:hypothetical protein
MRVSEACRPFAVRAGLRRAWVRVVLDGRTVTRAMMLEPSAPVLLQGCVANELEGRTFVHPVEGEDTFPILF